MAKKKTVFITGTSGSMGGEGLKELLRRRDKYDIVTLVRPSKKNKEGMASFMNEPGLKIVWGDLVNYEDVLKCLTGTDIVLHPAAFIAPAADHDPDTAWKINVGSTQNIINAIKAQPDPDSLKFVYIGSVASTGDRLYPIHVGRTGDPFKPSVYDMYACSKIAAERTVAESGLKYWVSCRQTYVAIPDTLGLMDPIMFHQPLNTCIEFCTSRDAGLLLANACEDDVPENFWRKFYNVGGGEKCRIICQELMDKVFSLIGLGTCRDLMERNWFATRNFHCQWFEDSDRLNDILHFRTMGLDEYVQSILDHAPWYVKLPGNPVISALIPRSLIKHFVLKPLAYNTPDCTMYWISNNIEGRISSFFKSIDDWKSIPKSWDEDMTKRPTFAEYQRLNHGYDEAKPLETLNIKDMKGAAEFRGGMCLSPEMKEGDLFTPLKWQCAFGHQFELNPNTVLKGGHWCPECAPPTNGWRYDEEAKKNPFFAQVWYPNHDKNENNFYPKDCYKDIV